jgi:hypothetical protein
MLLREDSNESSERDVKQNVQVLRISKDAQNNPMHRDSSRFADGRALRSQHRASSIGCADSSNIEITASMTTRGYDNIFVYEHG